MFATFWFLIKTVFIISVFAWLLMAGGLVTVDAFDYRVTTTFGLFVVILMAGIYILSFIGRVVRAVFTAPKTIGHMYERRSFKTGMQSLTYGLSAVAAGDIKAATYYTNKATRLLKDDYGLVALLSGLTARLKGDEKQAETAFKTLLNRDETSFLGLRGLLQTALDRGDYRYARVLARQAYTTNPTQAWIVTTLYDLEIRHKDFDAALPLLKQAVKCGAIDRETACTEEAAIALARGDVAKAYKASPTYLPVVIAILKEWPAAGKRRKSMSLIKRAWMETPHPALMEYWMGLAPKKAQDKPHHLLAWGEDLRLINPDDVSSNLYMADIALRYDFTAQARRCLEKAIQIKPTMRAYQLMARIDVNGGWNDLMPSAAHDKAWICTETGRIFDQWQPFSGQGHFNTVSWNYPDDINRGNLGNDAAQGAFFITDVKAA